jgi:hypothetical protein
MALCFLSQFDAERFNKASPRVQCDKGKVSAEQVEAVWKLVSNASERQLGAFVFSMRMLLMNRARAMQSIELIRRWQVACSYPCLMSDVTGRNFDCCAR